MFDLRETNGQSCLDLTYGLRNDQDSHTETITFATWPTS